MNTTAIPANQCLECQAPLSAAETHGLCARCLLKMGLASQFGETSVADAGARKFVPPPMFPFDFGGYRVLRLLGRGGMGAVYEAEQIGTGRRVALKVLGHTIDSPEMRKRFLREGRLAASVNHPNSVYIFGTEEIDGAPVIAMELVAGGTLRDQVKSGPLAVRDAVDAILHVIAGLEAAAGAGVLHRDVKPANCFVAPDGTVKVGDFGLSVSTLARHDSQLTASGMMLGTPSFAPPEQLRGDELDVRADIYSVGATLYSLLTGHAPFEGDNAVQVVAAVLDKVPKPIAEFRQDVPSGLVQVVSKCLAKKREERFANYAAVRDALTPFSSQAREPAPLGLRIVAGFVDSMFVGVLNIAIVLATSHNKDAAFLSEAEGMLAHPPAFFAMMAMNLAYFALPEGLWGASFGKMLCRLRVAALGRGAPGLALATLRAAIFTLMGNAGAFTQVLFGHGGGPRHDDAIVLGTVAQIVGVSFLLLFFVTMRRRNGFATVSDLLTRTRVIARPKADERPRLEAVSVAAPVSQENAERLGPFRIVQPIGDLWLAGYDEVLRRNVWIRKCVANTPQLPPARRDLGRAGRLRWIAGARSESESWDAFDAPTGKPLVGLINQPWSAVRCWLLDLAEELDAASKDGTLPPEIGLDQVWITAAGHALLLDEPQPGIESSSRFACADIADAQRFLSAVAAATLDRPLLPLHARDFLQKLGAAAFDRASFIAGNLRSLLAKPAAISRRRRFASIMLVPALVLLFAIPLSVFLLVQNLRETARWTAHPEWQNLEAARSQYEILKIGSTFSFSRKIPKPQTDKTAELYAQYIADHFGKFITSPEFDSAPEFSKLSKEERDELREIVRSHPLVKPDKLHTGPDMTVEINLPSQIEGARMAPYMTVPAALLGTLPMICVSQFLALLIFGATLGQRLFGFAVVNKSGEPAGRGRMLWRWCLVWWSMIGGLIATVVVGSTHRSTAGHCGLALFALSALSFPICVPWAVLRPTCGPLDRLAGTRIVPR